MNGRLRPEYAIRVLQLSVNAEGRILTLSTFDSNRRQARASGNDQQEILAGQSLILRVSSHRNAGLFAEAQTKKSTRSI